MAPEKCKVTQAADLCSSHYISVDSVAPEWKKGLNLPLFGFPEQLPAYLIMYNQKSGNRHTGVFWSEVFTPSRFLPFFFWSPLGLGEKYKLTICYACLAFKRESRLNCFWAPPALTLWLSGDRSHWGKVSYWPARAVMGGSVFSVLMSGALGAD